MRLIRTDNYEQMSEEAAKLVAGQLWLKPASVLGLATGSTPLGLYKKLVDLHDTVGLSFAQTKTFNLDEYVGLTPADEQSYHYFMQKNLFSRVDIKPENTVIPDGMAEDPEKEGERYERAIAAAGGIDLQILGIGRNAHIGFNEPAYAFARITHKVALKADTIEANSRFFKSLAEVPKSAISMGIGSIMKSRHIVLLASGEAKAEAVKKAFLGDITPLVPASILQLHPAVTLIVDKESGAMLPR